MLIGRDRECRTLERLLDAARAGHSAALVVRGESGVGKTALLEHMRERASGCRVVSVSAVKSETHLAFAALHQLCVPLFDGLGRLPDPQRDALDVAFGQTEGVPADPFFLGLAVLSLLSAAADERPLVCLVDDADWSDPESTQVLGFVARRPPESVALVLAARDRHSEFASVPELHVGGLPDRDARTLLMSALRAPLDEQVRERIVAEAEGNALAVLEVPRRVTPAQLAGGFGRPDAGTVASRAEAIARAATCLATGREPAAVAARRRGASGRAASALARRRATRHPVRRGGGPAGGGHPRDRDPRAVSPSAAARGDLPVGIPPRAVPGPQRARRCHRRAI